MKRHLLVSFILTLLFLSSCGDDPGSQQPIEDFETDLKGEINSKNLNINSNSILPIFFQDEGDDTGSLEVSSQLPNSEKLVFFIDEVKQGTVNLTQVFPAVMGYSSDGLRLEAKESSGSENKKTSASIPSFVKYSSGSNTFFAVAGSLEIKVDGANITVSWNLVFKGTDGNNFTSKGTFNVADYKKNTKSRSQINNPTSTLSIASISPNYGRAGTEVVLKGTGFSGLKTENSVKLNDLGIEVLSSTATEIKISMPEGGEHGKLLLTVLGSTAESDIYYYEPIISAISKESARVGEELVLTGNHFDLNKDLLEVKIGDQLMEILSATLTSLTVKVPEGAKTSKINVARKGKAPVEGPELKIVETPPSQGLPVDQIFEVVSGNLVFEEVLSNGNDYGAIWNIQIDPDKNVLYAVTASALLKIDLSTNAVTKLAGQESDIYKNDLNMYNFLTLPMALYPKGDVLYGLKNPTFMISEVKNGFRLNLSTNTPEMLGDHKISNGADPYGMFVGDNNRIYLPEFISPGPGYTLVSYDLNFTDRKILHEDAGNFTFLLGMGGNKYRYVTKRTIHDSKYIDGDGETISDFISWTDQLKPIQFDTYTRLIGMDYRNSNFYVLAATAKDGANVGATSYPKLHYNLGMQSNGNGNFQKMGEFSIKQTFQFNGNTYYIRSQESAYKSFAVDKHGDVYILLQSPIHPSTGEELSPGAGGIYRVKF
ncbi:IPT/TIG domain-containing protein [Algoriphagus vanfongensis]|uniref:IPT/TIG domain-containing protein n=1 Tax=Algoriphagus vanfongensis TaxID=426371 RepID=UPI0003F58674|nr:IPT/TIG domain-containing protein [Algoriphagus vanfongensis]